MTRKRDRDSYLLGNRLVTLAAWNERISSGGDFFFFTLFTSGTGIADQRNDPTFPK